VIEANPKYSGPTILHDLGQEGEAPFRAHFGFGRLMNSERFNPLLISVYCPETLFYLHAIDAPKYQVES
jgi:hypothetical protein